MIKSLLRSRGHSSGAIEIMLAAGRRSLVRNGNVHRRDLAGHAMGGIVRRLNYGMLFKL